ncbi:polysaccharide lyase family 4-like protein [Anseongella ginsenosidimutans]|uniref:Polysaccharide lyase family 4-like protein n=1 Tax=Anseongella ginsenosidimutans TaxID=496056 RepID=A0A4R3KUF8_9SPHI|nr:Ig-like domain-containing protein [Anseongella ginsenosidimutans]QEC51587.1 hypothetical protein FRZ59_03970 [Anseongella ginsenosidimutans]TCS88915.1 polysaccharide lyase family 4-like protein [Anseongella ginsenosidimutans]
MDLKIKRRFSGLLVSAISLLTWSCAVQQTPTGGEKDIEPPKLVSVYPPNETLNFKAEEIQILFNEYVQLKNAFQEITISPDPETRPEFRTKKTAIIVKFTDTLEENTTYQINFGKAIGDMNEGNPFPNFKYVFSTGNQIDSLRIRGSVGIYSMGKHDPKSTGLSEVLVLIHKEQDSIPNQDSLIMKKKPGYYTYADSSGNFEITNLKEGTYRLYAIKEENDSRIYDESDELLAFLPEPLALSSDTLLPRVYLATMQQEDLQILNDRNQDARLTLLLNKKTDSLSLEVLSPENFKGKLLMEEDMATDSVVLWLPTPAYDSVKLAVGENNRYIDTILFRNFSTKEKLESFGVTDNIIQNTLPPGEDPELTFSRPVNLEGPGRIELQEDSVILQPTAFSLRRLSLRKYAVEYNWKPRSAYQITIGAGYLTDMYGFGNNAYQRQFIADSLENYGNITVSYTLSDSLPADTIQYLVQLLDADNRIIKSDTITSPEEITYSTLRPAKYIMRIIYDRNKNGRWDGTNLFEKIPPEKILTFDPDETLRANWDQEYTIAIPSEYAEEFPQSPPTESPETPEAKPADTESPETLPETDEQEQPADPPTHPDTSPEDGSTGQTPESPEPDKNPEPHQQIR